MKKQILLLLAVLLMSSFYNCSRQKNEEKDTSEIQYSETVAQIVSKITSGTILPTDYIEVEFHKNMVNEEQLNKEIDSPFELTPKVKGKVVWVATNTLRLIPENPLKTRANYVGRINLKDLKVSKQVESVDFKFYVEGQSIKSFKGKLDVPNQSMPGKVAYAGRVVFTQNIDVEQVKKATDFDGVNVNWIQESKKELSFVSDPINRTESVTEYNFTLNKNELDLEESYLSTVKVYPLSELKVDKLEKLIDGKSPSIVVSFSDVLLPEQDLNGFITVEPKTNFTIQKIGKNIMLQGDFNFGTAYQVKVNSGVRSKWHTLLEQNYQGKVEFENIAPQVEFASDGVFMPTTNNNNLQFLTTNLKRVHVEIKKVFNSNIETFIKRENTKSGKTRTNEFNNTYVSSIGAIVYNETLEIGDHPNKWLVHNISLSKVFKEFDNGIYLIRINFNPADFLVPISGDQLTYIQKHGQIFKPLTISNIGLLVKREYDNKYRVYTTDLRTGAPMKDVKVTVNNYDRNFTYRTNEQGIVSFSAQSYFRFIKAEKDKQISYVEPYENQWNNSGFDVGGLSPYDLQTQAFTYTERGVYRPGDSINLSCIVRYDTKKAGSEPIMFRLYNPEGSLILEKRQTKVKDGFYNFNFGTNLNDPTGTWDAQILVGNKYFHHSLKIETVVANRLKVKVTPAQKKLQFDQKQLKVEVESRYLFGASAAGLKYDSDIEILSVKPNFKKYSEYNFENQNVEFQDIKTKLQQGRLDDNGKVEFTWDVPQLVQAPSALKVKLSASVSEEGGRPNDAWTFVDYFPYPHYVGIKKNFYSAKLNAKQELSVVLLDTDGNPVIGKELTYRIYRNDKYWWYQYNNYKDFKLRYKTDKHSYLVEDGTVVSSENTKIPFYPTVRGQYMIEVQDASTTYGHVSNVFVSAYPYGGIPSGDENAGTLALRCDKASYNVGEFATLTFPSPKQGNVLITVEQGEKILMSRWVEPKETDEMQVSLKISKQMAPNVYITVAVLQSHDQTINDRPMRMFGILPITVNDPSTKEELVISMPDELSPKQDFEVEINTVSKKAAQFTVAVVDEGLLDLTAFRTPNPWKKFNSKIRLSVETWDMFGNVIGANRDDVFKTFSIGGDMDYRESQVDPFAKKKRFKPICMFQGPISTNDEGYAKVKFTMPNYVGSVRVMVISANDRTFGSAEKTVPVKSDLIIQPTIPRALKPGDEFKIPVNIFATVPNLGTTQIELLTEGPIQVVGGANKKINFTSVSDTLIYFDAKVIDEIGQGKITINGGANGKNSSFSADVAVTASSSRVYQASEDVVKPGETIAIPIPKLGLNGTNNARLKLSVFPNMDFQHRLEYLIHYPYGCIEQTVSSVFPQLAMKSIYTDEKLRNEIDKNIEAGIERLRMFQLASGGFSYWPGGTYTSHWGTNYATEFLIQARKRGYVVPDLLYDGAVRFLENESKHGNKEDSYLMYRVNRCYILAMAGKAPLSEMNLLRQNSFSKMNSVQQWMLITSYALAGAKDKVASLMTNLTTQVDDYQEFSGSYGSGSRDLGIILQCMVYLDNSEQAELTAKAVAKKLSTFDWYSTQTVSQMLLGLGNYFDYAGISGANDIIVEGKIELPGGEVKDIKTINSYELYINKGYGEDLKLTLDPSMKVSQMYASLASNGLPMKDQTTKESKNISIDVQWLDENGDEIDVRRVKQGDTFYGLFRVQNNSVISNVDEVALVQILPSGWEIENTRLNGSARPSWMLKYTLDKEEYVDIRDDRIMWFFDLTKYKADFLVKINAITEGKFTLPATRCEAMYNNDYRATTEPQTVMVVKE